MYDIYEREFSDAFAGNGRETLIVKDKVILLHTIGWDDPAAVAGAIAEGKGNGRLTGQPLRKKGTGWRKLRGPALEHAQAWAIDCLDPA